MFPVAWGLAELSVVRVSGACENEEAAKTQLNAECREEPGFVCPLCYLQDTEKARAAGILMVSDPGSFIKCQPLCYQITSPFSLHSLFPISFKVFLGYLECPIPSSISAKMIGCKL